MRKTSRPFSLQWATKMIPVVISCTLSTQVWAQSTNIEQSDSTIVKINGAPLTQASLIAYKKTKPNQQLLDNNQLLKELVNLELLSQDARKLGIDKTRDIVAEIDMQNRSVLARARVAKLLRENPVTDDDVREAYEQRLAEMSRYEYKISHIVTRNKSDGRQVIASLKRGQEFAELAETKSTDLSGRRSGGSLGWLNPTQMPPPIAEAVKSLSKGKYTRTPIETPFGWHVVLLEDRRELNPPSFENVKSQVRSVLENNKIASYIDSLRKRAKITKE